MTLDYFINNNNIIIIIIILVRIKILVMDLYTHDWFDFKVDSICRDHPWSFRHDFLVLESHFQIEMWFTIFGKSY